MGPTTITNLLIGQLGIVRSVLLLEQSLERRKSVCLPYSAYRNLLHIKIAVGLGRLLLQSPRTLFRLDPDASQAEIVAEPLLLQLWVPSRKARLPYHAWLGRLGVVFFTAELWRSRQLALEGYGNSIS